MGTKYLMIKSEENPEVGLWVRLRNKLIDRRMKDIEARMTNERVDLLRR